MEIIWSPQAKKDFWNNIDYLKAEWSNNVVVNFIEKVNSTITRLEIDNLHFIKTITKMFIKWLLQNIFHSFIEKKTIRYNYSDFGITIKI